MVDGRWVGARWWRRRSLRARLTLITSAGLAVALAAAALLLVNALRLSLIRGLDDSARQGAAEVAALIDQNRLPDPVPVGSGTITIQVLDAQGRITDVSEGADRLVPLLPAAQARTAARTGQGRMLSGPPLGMPSPLRVVAVGADDGQVVVAAVSFAQASDSIATVAKAVFIGTPLLFGLVALAIWLVTGYTLRPIAGLRRGAAEVTQTGIPRHLPVPPARDEVRSLAVTLNDMLSRLADAQQRQRDLVSDTAHELRSPIASIRAQLEVALDHPDGLDWAETARDVHADTLRLARLAENLLLLARLDDQRIRRRPVDLAEVCGSVAARYGTARVPVLADAPGPCPVLGDPDALGRLLVNLLDNAVRHAASAVSVSVRAQDGCAVLVVADDGPGIAAEDTERAFGRFSRLDDARSRDGQEGAGLGLAIVRTTAEAHGGSVTLGDAGPGLRATVRLPLAQDAVVTSASTDLGDEGGETHYPCIRPGAPFRPAEVGGHGSARRQSRKADLCALHRRRPPGRPARRCTPTSAGTARYLRSRWPAPNASSPATSAG
jgi:signal transduction histidine kinase